MSKQNPLDEVEQFLKELEKELLERINTNQAATESPKMDSAVGRLTYIDAYQQEQMALHSRRQLRDRLASVRAALMRVKAGTYGKCSRCGDPISSERLEYMPEAAHCAECHSIHGR